MRPFAGASPKFSLYVSYDAFGAKVSSQLRLDDGSSVHCTDDVLRILYPTLADVGDEAGCWRHRRDRKRSDRLYDSEGQI